MATAPEILTNDDSLRKLFAPSLNASLAGNPTLPTLRTVCSCPEEVCDELGNAVDEAKVEAVNEEDHEEVDEVVDEEEGQAGGEVGEGAEERHGDDQPADENEEDKFGARLVDQQLPDLGHLSGTRGSSTYWTLRIEYRSRNGWYPPNLSSSL
ncbi:unnamed protein product [Bursaphelenchus okinawaensis]|uniref:Uncharacterized protein n=1 Tax=Bursaphelenchus okinawaensis TaxID=465554 RepID=A0A811KHY2_9BILA|nr:unnamed protein product [Bursaphelenchus okinawaensis]CAG9102766.1 unnamed protein product [Bursaphelenchus okinawaensis]